MRRAFVLAGLVYLLAMVSAVSVLAQSGLLIVIDGNGSDWRPSNWVCPGGSGCPDPQADYTAWMCCNQTSQPRECMVVWRNQPGSRTGQAYPYIMRIYMNDTGIYVLINATGTAKNWYPVNIWLNETGYSHLISLNVDPAPSSLRLTSVSYTVYTGSASYQNTSINGVMFAGVVVSNYQLLEFAIPLSSLVINGFNNGLANRGLANKQFNYTIVLNYVRPQVDLNGDGVRVNYLTIYTDSKGHIYDVVSPENGGMPNPIPEPWVTTSMVAVAALVIIYAASKILDQPPTHLGKRVEAA